MQRQSVSFSTLRTPHGGLSGTAVTLPYQPPLLPGQKVVTSERLSFLKGVRSQVLIISHIESRGDDAAIIIPWPYSDTPPTLWEAGFQKSHKFNEKATKTQQTTSVVDQIGQIATLSHQDEAVAGHERRVVALARVVYGEDYISPTKKLLHVQSGCLAETLHDGEPLQW